VWGLPREQLAKLPGYGDPVKDKAQARRLLVEAGYGPGHPLKVTVSTRGIDTYTETANWVVAELNGIGIEATLEPVETVSWYARLARREFTLGVNRTSAAAGDPDAIFSENYACGALRNYSDTCMPELDAQMDKVSLEVDAKKRLQMTWDIDRRLQEEGVRPTLAHRVGYYMHWPYVKGMTPKHNSYNYGRMTDVWLDR
jgi:peptide/nickel transport system substrate-binding protein